jgi:hypothetical protein
MFVLLPLITLGSMYLIAKKALIYLDLPDVSAKLDTNTKLMVGKIGSHTQLKLSGS